TSQSCGRATAAFSAAPSWPSGAATDTDGAQLLTASPLGFAAAATGVPGPCPAPIAKLRGAAAAAAAAADTTAAPFQLPEYVTVNMAGPGAAPDMSSAANFLRRSNPPTPHASHQPSHHQASPYGNAGGMAVSYSHPLPPAAARSFLGPAPAPVTRLSPQPAPIPSTATGHTSDAVYMYTPLVSSLTLNSTPPGSPSKSSVAPFRAGPSAAATVRPYGARNWQTHTSTSQPSPASLSSPLRPSVPQSLITPTTPPDHPSSSGATTDYGTDSRAAALSPYLEHTSAAVAPVTTTLDVPRAFVGSCPPAAASYACGRDSAVTATEPVALAGAKVRREWAAASAAGGAPPIQFPNPFPPFHHTPCPSPHTPCTPTVLASSPLTSPATGLTPAGKSN
ncbi:hypothetical protein Vafri_2620, partial [Volvox africanus]